MTTHSNAFPFQRHGLALALMLATVTAHAATINVGGFCSLASAINNANSDADTDGRYGCPAGSGADIINLKANKIYTLTTVNNQEAGPNGLPAITSVITINGNGATIKRSKAAGIPDFRLLRVISGSGDLILNAVKLTGGSLTGAQQYGGAIRNGGHLTLNNCTISGNSAADAGGGIVNTYQGVLTINNSTISGNKSPGAGGLVNLPDATATINNSSISGNIATNGRVAGVLNAGTMTMTNSTVSGNRSKNTWGTGGIDNSGALTLNHTTVSDNSIEVGSVAGISSSGTMTLVNSIVANSINGSDCYTNTNYGGVTIFQGRVLIEDGTCNSIFNGDPKLFSFLDNGGPTLTHALNNRSPALNIADSLCVSIDQRYVSRPQPVGGFCDIGAFEQIKLIPSIIKPLISFFDAQVSSGGIVGIGAIPTHKLNAVRNQLLTAGDNKIASLDTQACNQLSKTLTRLDADNSPDNNEYATGSQISGLIAQINTLRSSWACH